MATLDAQHLYIDMVKRCLLGFVYEDAALATFPSPGARGAHFTPSSFDRTLREVGKDWPSQAHTMIGLRRMDNLQCCVEQVLSEKVPGDLIETGVWRGGATIFMRALLKAHAVSDRMVWVADSFQGLPPRNPERYPADRHDPGLLSPVLSVSLETVQRNFDAYGLLDDLVRFLPGWFKDTLPAAPIQHLAILRLDGDMYESTMDALTHLYPKLSPGGFCIIDDYVLRPCARAVADYREQHGITEELVNIDDSSVFWQRRTG